MNPSNRAGDSLMLSLLLISRIAVGLLFSLSSLFHHVCNENEVCSPDLLTGPRRSPM